MPERYTPIARAVHWATAAGVMLMAVLGFWMTLFEPADETLKYLLYDLHENTGVTLFFLTLFRLWWRRNHPPPALPAGLPPAMRAAAHGTHHLLYLLLLAMPVAGFLGTNAWGFPLTWWWVLPLPDPIGPNEALAPVFSTIHFWLAMLLIALVMVHAGAALWHHFIRRDDTLRRMA